MPDMTGSRDAIERVARALGDRPDAVHFQDLLAHESRMDADRQKALDEIARLDQDLGLS